MKPGEVFVAVEGFRMDQLVWKGKPDPDPECPEPEHCAKCRGEGWSTHWVEKGDTLMFKGFVMGYEVELLKDYYRL